MFVNKKPKLTMVSLREPSISCSKTPPTGLPGKLSSMMFYKPVNSPPEKPGPIKNSFENSILLTMKKLAGTFLANGMRKSSSQD